MRKQNSKKGCPRKVIHLGKAILSFTGKAAIPHADMAVVSRAHDYFHVREDLKTHTTDLDASKHHKMNSLLEQLITLRMLGGEAVSDNALLNEPVLGALFDWDEITHPSTFGRRLGQMRWVHNLGLECIVTGLSNRVIRTGQRLVAIDSTVASAFGEQIEGAVHGYNPHKAGRDSYHPMLSVDVANRSVVDGYLRPGSCASGHGPGFFLAKVS